MNTDKVVDTNNKVDDINIEDNKLNEDEYIKALDILNSFNLNWNYRSIRYVINNLNIGLGQLRSCVYVKNGCPMFDYIESTINLIKAGLIGSKQYKETQTDEIENRAFEIIDEWANNGLFIGTLHLMIINQMETKHFFMGMQDLRVINHLSSKNLQTDLLMNLVKEDVDEKLKQTQAYLV